jgi:hypothetical protein
MTPEHAVTVLANTIFRPGWTLSAETAGRHHVSVVATVRTQNTSYADRYGQFTMPITIEPPAVRIDVSALDETGLLHAVYSQLIHMIEEHESREFLQVRTARGWYAPLHPHTDEGERAWRQYETG